MRIDVKDVTPCCQIANEDYWIYYVLRDVYEIFDKVIVLDTGSDDSTKTIIKSEFPNVHLIEESYGHDANKIGNGRNVLREKCQTYWMYLIDGDEIYRRDTVLKIFDQDIKDNTQIVMLGLASVEDVNGQLKLRTHDYINRDGIFAPNIKWKKTDYPFESYGLTDKDFPMDAVHYLPANEIFGYHMRHTIRSTRNDAVFYRKEKYGYFPYNKGHEDLPENWIGEVNTRWPNHYLHG